MKQFRLESRPYLKPIYDENAPTITIKSSLFTAKSQELLSYEYPLWVVIGGKWAGRWYRLLKAVGWYRIKSVFKKPHVVEQTVRDVGKYGITL